MNVCIEAHQSGRVKAFLWKSNLIKTARRIVHANSLTHWSLKGLSFLNSSIVKRYRESLDSYDKKTSLNTFQWQLYDKSRGQKERLIQRVGFKGKLPIILFQII